MDVANNIPLLQLYDPVALMRIADSWDVNAIRNGIFAQVGLLPSVGTSCVWAFNNHDPWADFAQAPQTCV